VLVWALDRKYKFGKGRAFALYVMAYTVGRFWIEALRSDDAVHFLGLRLNDWTSIVVFLGALAYFLRVHGPREYVLPAGDGHFEVVDEATYLAGARAELAESSSAPDAADSTPDGAAVPEGDIGGLGASGAGVDPDTPEPVADELTEKDASKS
jgi:hypothetical protein